MAVAGFHINTGIPDEYKRLYVGLLSGLILIWFTALGGGLYGSSQPWITEWQHQMFHMLCHQDPDRSFWIGGRPMAVCARCFGIYSGLLGTWLCVPFLRRFITFMGNITSWALAGALALNFIDFTGNAMHFWINNNISRCILGLLLGITAVLYIASEFLPITQDIKGTFYGNE